jgi:hypothetical protein
MVPTNEAKDYVDGSCFTEATDLADEVVVFGAPILLEGVAIRWGIDPHRRSDPSAEPEELVRQPGSHLELRVVP